MGVRTLPGVSKIWICNTELVIGASCLVDLLGVSEFRCRERTAPLSQGRGLPRSGPPAQLAAKGWL